MISKGSDINARDFFNQVLGQLFFIKIYFNRKRKLNDKNWTPLHFAAMNNSREIEEILLLKGADINTRDIIYQNFIILLLINLILNK